MSRAVSRYMVVVDWGATSWGAHVPDLPGCVAVGETRDDVLRLIRDAIELHINALKQDGLPARLLRALETEIDERHGRKISASSAGPRPR